MSPRIRFSLLIAAISFGLLVVQSATAAPDQRATLQGNMASMARPTVEQHRCSIRRLAVFPDRIHIECSRPNDRIRYFATSTQDPAASMYLQLAALAKGPRRHLPITFYRSAKHNPEGCLKQDCRQIAALEY